MSKARPSPNAAEWVDALAVFLQESSRVEAIRVDAAHHRVEVATLGEVDVAALQARLEATLAAIEQSPHSKAIGVAVDSKPDGGLELSKATCLTAPKLWRWRELSMPGEAAAEEEDWRTLAMLAGACAILGLTAWGMDTADVAPAWLPMGLYLAAMLAGGWDAFQDAREGLPKGELDIHFLMLAVAVGAACIGAWAEGALLLFLFSFSGALEHFALHRTRREINSLFDAAPKTALRVDASGSEHQIPVSQVQVGHILSVKPGGLFPVDAEVIEGKTAADESNLTGEANPVAKLQGDPVFSGTLNLWGAVHVRATKLAGESALQKVIRLIQEAQHLKAPSQRFTDRFGTGYTVGILGLTALMFFVWWLGFGIPAFTNTELGFSAFYRAMTLLVVASPCALVISIPSAILASIAWGARHGVLFRGGAAIEKLAEVNLVALDKTGTLTTGEMEVDRIESFPPGREDEALELAYSLESHGSHPIGRAIQKYAKAQGAHQRKIDDFEAMSGQGVQGRAGDALCVLGRRELLEAGPLAEWIQSVPEPSQEFVENWIFKGDLIARILLRDQIRLESAATLEALRGLGVRTVMLTGDRRAAAESVGSQIGIDEIRAALSPEGKVSAIREYTEAGYKVAMVGDGVNDAPCLAAAYVSVAMGARGSDAALEQSEVVLMKDRIENFLAAVSLSNRARAIIRQNLAIALGTVILMAGAAILGWIPLSIGVFAHEGSTVVVCLNSLRLLFKS
ncbi:cation-translocating P-type ATPase [Coraliomargarita sp. SDUM461003]|uniref:Cation-translocating P-type ATPase n=1 Tax=Thalassobacterium maritimum TaxID=3041265 RepID=A0ABU1AYH4_9BACT|nr:cation-translocating P-type ATPase [Coraliomargarita sp. SDUM461003]MDQ8209185.1 cation-translocating P-type ATPase [Coraliomargarita sp. SDUM461003]